MSDYLRFVAVFPKLVRDVTTGQSEWRVMLEVGGGYGKGDAFPLTPTEAKDLQQKLFALAVEISERESPAQLSLGVETLEEVKRELEREREKRQELARKVAPKEKLEAVKGALQIALEECPPSTQFERESPNESTRSNAQSRDDVRAKYEAALAWIEEFRA